MTSMTIEELLNKILEADTRTTALEQRVAALESQLKPIKEIPGSETDCWSPRWRGR